MKIKLFILATSFPVLLSCQSEQKKIPVENTTLKTSKNKRRSSCYQYSSSQDSVLLHLNPVGDSIKGQLIYALAGKDYNTGTIAGQMKGDTLFADYTFLSEGQISVRQVAFLKKDQTWIEGYGEVTNLGQKSAFANKAAINFDNSILLKPMPCQQDAHSCLTSFGFTWSNLQRQCVPIRSAGIRLNPLKKAEVRPGSAFILFSEDQQQAELFLPAREAILLNRQGAEGQHHWGNGAWKLYPWKGYILKQADKLMYAGQ
ncbi:hypothetical protein [Adhaeribacter pallidiroseus]|uniref:Lipoprotein n=1 Tax=Adhaeribacter pallidiroseus TaxID=2072847 RepID=A0A369QFV6_9BACT|nr:hypothetical protein [Adhaeribacter pallidiroseus]RDC62435.1 hypothetical protein AHMF7616_01029 [Adhaeribacter pallidiroseus]